MCRVELAHRGVSWTVNDTVLRQQLPGSLVTETYSGNITTSILTFPSQSSYNLTTFQCRGQGRDGDVAVSDEATLFYQGICNGIHAVQSPMQCFLNTCMFRSAR